MKYYKHILGILGLCMLVFSIIHKNPNDHIVIDINKHGAIQTKIISGDTAVNGDSSQQSRILESATSSQLMKVVKVIDGDTIKVADGDTQKTIRMIGINTPEMNDTRSRVKCLAKVAKRQADELLLNHMVQIKVDPSQDLVDRYGRTLGYVIRYDGLFFNKYMIESGYAYEYTYRTAYEFQAEFRTAEAEAKQKVRGLWNDGVCI